MSNQTITAIATPPGEGALAVIRLSGPQAISLVQSLCKLNVTSLEPRKLILCSLFHPSSNEFIDQVMLCKMIPPTSFTGELMIEIYSHGGYLIPGKIQNLLIELGAKPADPGEFSQRAVLNGKMDLLCAESVQQMIQAKSLKELTLAQGNFRGFIHKDLSSLIETIMKLITTIEASLCFPEDVMDEELQINQQMSEITLLIDHMVSIGTFSRDLQKGYRILISGKTNVGKSSLFNTLFGWERMKVSPYPSTTHDYVSERLNLNGFPVYLIDSAGWIEDPGNLDKIFNETILELIQSSFLVLFVVDITDIQAFDHSLLEMYNHENLILVFNKLDLRDQIQNELLDQFPVDIPKIVVSTQTKDGIQELISTITQKLKHSEPEDSYYLINERQNNLLLSLQYLFGQIQKFPDPIKQLDMIRFELNDAIHILEEIKGENVSDEIYNNIFETFCIGK